MSRVCYLVIFDVSGFHTSIRLGHVRLLGEGIKTGAKPRQNWKFGDDTKVEVVWRCSRGVVKAVTTVVRGRGCV